MRRRLSVAVVGVFALLASGACATLPTSGEPHEFAIEAPQREPLRQFGSAPQEGSSPEQLVDDFIRAASAGVYDDFATARLYLTAEAAAAWEPGTQVVVFPAGSPPSASSEDEGDGQSKVVLTVDTIGSVDQSGALSVPSPSGKTNVAFTLTTDEDGEWRISELDNGLILSQPAFLSAYQSVNLYFPSADLSALVPDPRWYPRTRGASHLVQGLIEGPSEQVAGAVDASVVENLGLPTSSVDVKDRAATVALEGETGTQQGERQALLWAIDTTLKQLPAVQTVTVKLNGVELEETLPSGPQYRLDRLAGIEDGAVVVGSSTATTVVSDPEAEGAAASDPTVGPVASSPAAWVVGGKLSVAYLGGAGEDVVVFHDVPGVGAPSVDRFGNVWVASSSAPHSLYLFTSDGAEQVMDAPVDGAVRLVRVSPDGARVALLVDSGGKTQVVLAALYRDPEGGTYSLQQAETLTQFSETLIDLTWVGETTIAGLAAHSGSQRSVEVQPLGGWIQTMTAPEGATSITASSIVGSMIVQREDGVAFQRAGAAWIELEDALEQMSFAG